MTVHTKVLKYHNVTEIVTTLTEAQAVSLIRINISLVEGAISRMPATFTLEDLAKELQEFFNGKIKATEDWHAIVLEWPGLYSVSIAMYAPVSLEVATDSSEWRVLK